MKVFKSKEFARFSRKCDIRDADLCRAVEAVFAGNPDADLGGGVFKQRIARKGEGKSGGFRTILIMRVEALAIFVYGFAKSERANISESELMVWRAIAKDLLPSEKAIDLAVQLGKLVEVQCS